MHELLKAVILGLVEGLTEFLPVSSTGHLIIVGSFLDVASKHLGAFEVVIQLGAILAVVVLYWKKFWGLLFPPKKGGFSGLYGIWLLFLTSLPACLLGLLAGGMIKRNLFNNVTVTAALAVGAVFILLVERRNGAGKLSKVNSLDQITPRMALMVGLFQCAAMWPGFSRSAATILGGMLVGFNRDTAAEYSFIAAVPVMFAATGYEMLTQYSSLTSADLPFFATGTIVSFVSALIAIKLFISLVRRISLRPFAVYRLALAAIMLVFVIGWS